MPGKTYMGVPLDIRRIRRIQAFVGLSAAGSHISPNRPARLPRQVRNRGGYRNPGLHDFSRSRRCIGGERVPGIGVCQGISSIKDLAAGVRRRSVNPDLVVDCSVPSFGPRLSRSSMALRVAYTSVGRRSEEEPHVAMTSTDFCRHTRR